MTSEGAIDCEKEEGLRLLLGGLSVSEINVSAWDNQSEGSVGNEAGVDVPWKAKVAQTRPSIPIKKFSTSTRSSMNGADEDALFSRAYAVNADGRMERPGVRVVDLSHEGRGRALIATQKFTKGKVIYTEQAAIATQLVRDRIRACQYCYQSLELISACCQSEWAHEKMTINAEFPMKDLWPVREMDFLECGTVDEKNRRDKYGRIQCTRCGSYFCSQSCYDLFDAKLGSCCKVTHAKEALPSLLKSTAASNDNNGDDEDDDSSSQEVQPAIILATRLFAATLQLFRTTGTVVDSEFDGLCGDATDVLMLELGMAKISTACETNVCTRQYSLEPVYSYLVELFQLGVPETECLSLDLFSALASKAARNGFGIRTQSPFRIYYSSLLRACGGRGSKRHEECKQQVARALGSKNGALERGMDRVVDEKVAPEIACLFMLTARINHACNTAANAEVHSQEFVDARVDVVAVHDIEAGEEITISYIGQSSRHHKERRQRELRAKYMFQCCCPICC